MIVGVLAPVAILGAIVLIVILFLQRGREGLDLSPRSILRLYLYIASLAGLVVFSIGAASVANYGLARAAIVFGLTTIVMLPTGIYQALANVILTQPEEFYRQGADALGGGIVSLPIWLVYLRLVVTEFRQAV